MVYVRMFFKFLNANGGAIQTMFAGLVALATVAYVALTKRMWSEMRQTNERLDRPNVVAVLEPCRAVSSIFELVLRNTGAVSVHDVTVDIAPRTCPGMTERTLGELEAFAEPIPVFSEGEQLRTLLLDYRIVASAGRLEDPITITVAYTTTRGRKASQSFVYRMSVYRGLSRILDKDLGDLVDALRDAKSSLKDIAKNTEELSSSVQWLPSIICRSFQR